jgi:hypothetical protein
MSHTPGKWSVSKIGNNYDQWMIYAEGQQGNVVDSCNGEANARLIAAAPDLLSACKRLLAAIEADYRISPMMPVQISYETNGVALDEARAAIAKAIGQTT